MIPSAALSCQFRRLEDAECRRPGPGLAGLDDQLADPRQEGLARQQPGAARWAGASPRTGNPARGGTVQPPTDPAGDGEWRFTASVDLPAAMEEGAPSLVLESLGRF